MRMLTERYDEIMSKNKKRVQREKTAQKGAL
jgi:predicted nucleic acid-binding Zn ribbon protein